MLNATARFMRVFTVFQTGMDTTGFRNLFNNQNLAVVTLSALNVSLLEWLPGPAQELRVVLIGVTVDATAWVAARHWGVRGGQALGV